MVHFYQNELRDIHSGKSNATQIFTIHQRRALRKRGILILTRDSAISRTILTPKTVAFLEAIREDVTEYFIEAKAYWERDYKK